MGNKIPMRLFIDANIFLRFYSYSDDRLEELKKLFLLIEKGDIVLYVPAQLRDEVSRNREAEIKRAYKDLLELKLEKGFPYIFRSHDDFSAILKVLKSFYEVKDRILKELDKDVRDKNLKADLVIKELFDKGENIDSAKYVDLARLRMAVGNPPGKDGSLGDAINWECLLETIPKGDDLFLISKDSDYQSPLNEKDFNGFLSDEWLLKKESEVFFYQSLTEWASKHQKDIMLKLEDEKSTLIDRLLQSGSYAETHLVIEGLSKHEDFSTSQTDQILSAGAFNSQVRWVLSDEDVRNFYNKLLIGKEEGLNPELLDTIKKGIAPKNEGEL
jgi:predicted nucleic acid-binding protein